MSAPLSQVWERMLLLNREVDSLIGRVLRAVSPSPAIGREIPWYGVVEARFDALPTSYAGVPGANSQARAGNNVVVSQWTNGSSRVYIRELSFDSFHVRVDQVDDGVHWDARVPNEVTRFPFNWRWNIRTSITGRYYSEDRVMGRSAGRSAAGTHLAFKEPLVVEPMETLAFECEYLGGFGQQAAANAALGTSAVVALLMSGYREGI